MLKLDDLQTAYPKEPEQTTNDEVLVIYQTRACLDTVCEALAFADQSKPETLKGELSNLLDQLTGCQVRLLIIETNDNDQEQQQISLLRRMLPSHCAIILLGGNNQVSTVREWRRMGISYQLWPADKEDIVDQLRLSLSQTSTRTAHAALRIGVTGVKGGAGTSLLSAQLARMLVSETGQSGLLVDHGYQGSNLHVMLGIATLEVEAKDARQLFTPQQDIDFVQASSLLIRLSEQLNYLSSSSLHTTHQAINQLTWDNSFIVEDCAAELPVSDSDWLAQLDTLIIVIPATFSGLCQGRVILEQLHGQLQKPECEKLRYFLVLNHCQPKQKVNAELARQYFKRTVHGELPWVAGCEEWLITGESADTGCPAIARPLRNIARTIIGKSTLTDTPLERLKRRIERLKRRFQ